MTKSKEDRISELEKEMRELAEYNRVKLTDMANSLIILKVEARKEKVRQCISQS